MGPGQPNHNLDLEMRFLERMLNTHMKDLPAINSWSKLHWIKCFDFEKRETQSAPLLSKAMDASAENAIDKGDQEWDQVPTGCWTKGNGSCYNQEGNILHKCVHASNQYNQLSAKANIQSR